MSASIVFHEWTPLTEMQLSSASPETIDILRNVEILSINQDPVVGLSISPFRWGINVSRNILITSLQMIE